MRRRLVGCAVLILICLLLGTGGLIGLRARGMEPYVRVSSVSFEAGVRRPLDSMGECAMGVQIHRRQGVRRVSACMTYPEPPARP